MQGIANSYSPTVVFSLFNMNVGSQKITITKHVRNVGWQTGFCQKNNDIKNNAANNNSKSKNNRSSEILGFISCKQMLKATIIGDIQENTSFYEEKIKALDVR